MIVLVEVLIKGTYQPTSDRPWISMVEQRWGGKGLELWVWSEACEGELTQTKGTTQGNCGLAIEGAVGTLEPN